MTDRIYYRVPEGTKVAEQIKLFNESAIFAKEAWKRFCYKHGADTENLYQIGGSLHGLCFKNNNPPNDLWRRDLKVCGPKHGFVVAGRTKEASALRKEMNSLPRMMDGWAFTSFFGHIILNGRMPNVTLNIIDGVSYIGVPYRSPMPEVCSELVEITTREYCEITGEK